MRHWGNGLGLRATALALMSAACALGAGLAVAPPPMDLRLPLLGLVLALLTGAAGSLTAAGARRTASVADERVAPALPAAPPSPPGFAPPPERGPHVAPLGPDHAELAAATRDLRNLLAEQRAELAAFREQTETSAHETTMLGARLAGLALDAEARLSAVIAHAAEASQRAERTLPEFAELLRRVLAERSGSIPSPDAAREAIQAGAAAAVAAASARFDAAVEGAARSLGAVMADASGQIAALADVAVALRRDADALDEAAVTVTTAGAGVIGGIADAMGHAEAFARTAEETRAAAQATIEAAAQAAMRGLVEASASLRREAENLLAAAVPASPVAPVAPVVDPGQAAPGELMAARELPASHGAQDPILPSQTPDLSAAPAAPTSSSAGLVEQLMDEVGEVMRRLRATLDQHSAVEITPTAASPGALSPPPPMAPPMTEESAPPLEQEAIAPAPAPAADAPAPDAPEPETPEPETIETTIRRLRSVAAALEQGLLPASPGRKSA